MRDYIKLIRVKHWLKNFLVFLPLFFNGGLFHLSSFLICLVGFFTISFSASIVYVINDMNDIENDRKHEKKKNRPLASGRVSIKQAIILLIFLLFITLGLSFWLYQLSNNIFAILIPFIYIVLNVLYSVWLKHIPIIDVVILVSGFLLRVIYGGIIVHIEVSKWLYLMVIFASFFLGFGKRRNEIIKNGSKSRKVLRYYNQNFLDKNMYMACTLALMSYSLWCVDSDTVARIGVDYLFWTIPLVMVIFQSYSLDIEGNSHGDPIEVLLANKVLLVLVTIYILVMLSLLYIV